MERMSSRPKVSFSDHSYSRSIIGMGVGGGEGGAKAPLAPQFHRSRCFMYISTHYIETYIQVQLLFPYSMKRCTNGVETLESIWHMGVSVIGRRTP